MTRQIRILRSPRRELAVVRTRTTMDRIGDLLEGVFEDVAAHLGPRGLLGDGPAIVVYDADGVAVAAGFPVPEPIEGDRHVVPLQLPEGEIITTTHVGPYSTLPEAHAALRRAAGELGRELGPLLWEEYWSPPETPPTATRTVICWMLENPR